LPGSELMVGAIAFWVLFRASNIQILLAMAASGSLRATF
jgi:hypothetical protein